MSGKIRLSFLAGLLLLISCNKEDRQTIKSLQGTWNETAINGSPVAPSAQDKLDFGPCKNREKELCDCTVTDASGAVAGTLDYEIADEGTSLVIKYHYNGLTTRQKHSIVELEGDHMKILWDFGNGSYTGTYAKVE